MSHIGKGIEVRKDKPSVSIILATYNRAENLTDSIKSVLEQNYEDFELIVVDDGSTDDTSDVVAALGDNRIRYTSYQPNRGVAHARNVGVEIAKAELVAFQDSDDEWLPGKLATQVEAILNAGPGVGVVYTDMIWREGYGKEYAWRSPTVARGRLMSSSPGSLDYQVLKVGIVSALVRKGCIQEAGGFDESLKRFEDLDLFIRLAFLCDFMHIKEPMVIYNHSTGVSSNPENECLARLALLDKYESLISREGPFLAYQYYLIGLCHLKSKRFHEALAFFWKAVRRNPGKVFVLISHMASQLRIHYWIVARSAFYRLKSMIPGGSR